MPFGVLGMKMQSQSIQSEYINGRAHRSGGNHELEPLIQVK